MGSVVYQLNKKLKIPADKRLIALVVATFVAIVATVALTAGLRKVLAAPPTLNVCNSGCAYTNIPSALSAATPGSTIRVRSDQTVTSTIVVDKQVTILGANNAKINTSGGSNVLEIQPSGVGTVIRNLDFQKSDKTTQDIIWINAAGVRLFNNNFSGQFIIGDGEVSRALVVSTTSGLDISNNTFSHLRQPAYINDNTQGKFVDNHVTHTKGLVMVSNVDIDVKRNTWGSGADTNVFDVALIPSAAPSYTDADVVKMSTQNNDAVVELQHLPMYTGPKYVSDAFVDSSDANNTGDEGNKLDPYEEIQSAMSRVVEGGTIHVKSGTYNEDLTFLKNGTQLVGEGAVKPVVNTAGATYGIDIDAKNNISISNLDFKVASGTNPEYHLKVYRSIGITVSDANFTGPGKTDTTPRATGGLDFNSTRSVDLTNVSVSQYSKNGLAVTAQYAAEDQSSQGYNLTNVSSDNNAWAGLAFYAYNKDGDVSNHIRAVRFFGANSLTNNGLFGLLLQGMPDLDCSEYTNDLPGKIQCYVAAAPNLNPTRTIWGGGGQPVIDATSINFSGNILDIVNWQKGDVNATGLGLVDAKVWDSADPQPGGNPNLGTVSGVIY